VPWWDGAGAAAGGSASPAAIESWVPNE
jgi:hypothetical protein